MKWCDNIMSPSNEPACDANIKPSFSPTDVCPQGSVVSGGVCIVTGDAHSRPEAHPQSRDRFIHTLDQKHSPILDQIHTQPPGPEAYIPGPEAFSGG